MIAKLLTERHFEFLSLKGGCRGSSESTHVKIPHCWKSHALAQLLVDKSTMSFPIVMRSCQLILNSDINVSFM